MGWKVGSLIACAFLVACADEPIKQKEYSNTEKARLYLSVANAALNQGDATGALQSLVQAEKLDDDLPEIYHSKALAYFGKHDLNTAIAEARKAIRLKADFSEANNTLGSLLISAGQYDEAVAPLMAAATDSLFRDSYKAWTNLGILKYKRGEFHQARVFFDRAILDAGDRACSAHYYRGQLLQKDEKLDQAIEDFRLATKKLCARFGEASFALAQAYEKKRDYTQAKKIFLEIREVYPNTQLAEDAMSRLREIP